MGTVMKFEKGMDVEDIMEKARVDIVNSLMEIVTAEDFAIIDNPESPQFSGMELLLMPAKEVQRRVGHAVVLLNSRIQVVDTSNQSTVPAEDDIEIFMYPEMKSFDTSKISDIPYLKEIPLDGIGLSVKAVSCLEKDKITNMYQLCQKSLSYLANLRALGENTLEEIFFKAYEYGCILERGTLMNPAKYDKLLVKAQKAAQWKEKLREELHSKMHMGRAPE